MLPIRVPSFIGVPFHGLVIDGTLTLPNSATMAYSGAVSPFTQILRNPAGVANARARTTEEQAADTAAGRQWLDYGIRNGVRFNGQFIGQGKPWILYSDPAGTVWRLELDRVNDIGVVKPRLYNRGPFGRIRHGGSAPPDYTLNTLLWSADITPTDDESLAAENTYVQEILQNAQGTKALYKIFRQITGASYAERYRWVRIGVDTDGGTRMSDLYELTISGTGSLEPGFIGQGISVSASLVANFSTLYSDSSVSVSEISELDITGQCRGANALTTFQVYVGLSAAGPSFGGSNEFTESFSAKIDAYYDDLDAIKYVERSYTDRHTYTASASASATQDIDPPNVTYCYLFNGSSTTVDELSASVTNAGVTISGAWDRTRNRAGDYDDCVTGLTSELPYECNAQTPVVSVVTTSEVETGALEEAEIYLTRLTAHGCIIVAKGYDDAGTKRFTRTVVAADGNTLALDPVEAPMTYAKLSPGGIAWNPVTGQIVSYPGQVVGFV